MYAILKIIVCVILLIVYFTLFGYYSLRRYFNGDVIIRRYVVSSEFLKSPGYLIFYISNFFWLLYILDVYLAPVNRNTGQPWKTMSNNRTNDNLMESFTNCSNKMDEQLKKCLETIAYSNEETVLNTNHRGHNKTQFSFGLYQA